MAYKGPQKGENRVMEEKIKIHVSLRVYEVLLKDCEAFEFYKGNTYELNKNAFLTALINNYYLAYQEKENALFAFINKHFPNSSNDAITLAVQDFNRREIAKEDEPFSSILSLKPTKASSAALAYIEKYLLKHTTLSEFFRNLFSSYALLPQDEREKIIFKENYEKIMEAIQKQKTIFVVTKKKENIQQEIMPYAIASSKEEMHCYLIGKHNEEVKAFRLSRITSITILLHPTFFTEEEITLCKKMIAFGPQFLYHAHEEPVIIRLTEKGEKMYHHHYIHRPFYTYKEKNFYTFYCSHDQILNYFKRFGKEAYIITPKYLQTEIYKFYKTATEYYAQEGKKK